ncbi:MAG: magnesium transporter [Parachlamydiales bacterium]|nr:magnesium transporter [Parachlamydiales bacterium]
MMGKENHIPVRDIVRPVASIVYEDQTVEEALADLQHKHIEDKVIYFYVLDRDDILKGVVSTRKFLLSEGSRPLRDIMSDVVISIEENKTLHEALEIFAQHSLLALPVVTSEGKFLGAIDVEMYIEESFDIADARHRSDIFQIIGLSLEDEKRRSVFGDYRLRMPWIFCTMFGGIVCAIISNIHQLVLSKILMLAMFIPLVLSLSESISMQAMTHSLQFTRRPRLTWRHIIAKAIKEWHIVALIALTAGVLVGIISLFWGEGIKPSLTLACGIGISVVTSASFGIFFPIVLHRGRLDPKVASGPVVLSLADIVTTTIYLSLATWWLL